MTNQLNKKKVLKKPIELDHIVIHPLWDMPEKKIDVVNAKPMRMTLGTKVALVSLQIYLALIVLLSMYRIFQLIGIFHQ